MLAEPLATLFPYTTLFRSVHDGRSRARLMGIELFVLAPVFLGGFVVLVVLAIVFGVRQQRQRRERDRKSTRLNSSHVRIPYAVFCLTKTRGQVAEDLELGR